MDEGGVSIPKFIKIHWQGFFLLLLPFAFALFMSLNDDRNFRCLYVILIMLTCWLVEPIPLAVTALMPITLMPMLDVLASDRACCSYFRSVITHFLLAMVIGRAAAYTHLNKRVAVHLLKLTSSDPQKLHILTMVTCVTMSMIVPNSIIVSLINPFVDGIVEALAEIGLCHVYIDDTQPKALKKVTKVVECFQLSMAYSVTVGGSGLIIGSSTNKNLKKIYDQRFTNAPDMKFGDFASFSLLPTILLEIFIIFYMRFMYFRDKENADVKLGKEEIKAANDANTEKYNSMGYATLGQYLLSALLIIVIVGVMFRDPVFTSGWVDELSPDQIMLDASILAIIVYCIFSFPADLAFLKCWDESSKTRTTSLLVWGFCMRDIPWELIFTIGCSGTLIEGARSSGLGKDIGEIMDGWKDQPLAICLLCVIILTSVITNIFVSSFSMLLVGPGIVEMGSACKVSPLYFMYPANLACNWAFVMPTCCPPNGIVRSTYHVDTWQMIKMGLIPTLVGIIIAFIFGAFWGNIVLKDLDKLPTWVSEETSKVDWGESLPDFKQMKFT